MIRPYHHGALREALLAAGEAILERDGVGALTLRATAREAGVSHGAPAHHFSDLAGLLSELAAMGYTRFRAALLTQMAAAGPAPAERLHAMGCGYVRFARDHPGLFLLMFRGERLDPARPALHEAMEAAYNALAEAAAAASHPLRAGAGTASTLDRVADIAAAWAIAHGLAMLLIDGRLRGLAENTDTERLVGAALSRLRL